MMGCPASGKSSVTRRLVNHGTRSPPAPRSPCSPCMPRLRGGESGHAQDAGQVPQGAARRTHSGSVGGGGQHKSRSCGTRAVRGGGARGVATRAAAVLPHDDAARGRAAPQLRARGPHSGRHNARPRYRLQHLLCTRFLSRTLPTLTPLVYRNVWRSPRWKKASRTSATLTSFPSSRTLSNAASSCSGATTECTLRERRFNRIASLFRDRSCTIYTNHWNPSFSRLSVLCAVVIAVVAVARRWAQSRCGRRCEAERQ